MSTPGFWRKSSYSNGDGMCVEVAFMPESAWRKSSFSNAEQVCVEVALGEATGVRDSKNPDGGVLVFDSAAWGAFRSVVKRA